MATLVIKSQNLDLTNTDLTTASGLGFFGSAGFGSSVQVGEYQETTFVTASGGAGEGKQARNTQFELASTSGVLIDGASTIPLPDVPNSGCPINIHFDEGSGPVEVQNAEAIVFNNDTGVSPLVKAVGLTAQAAEVVNAVGLPGSGTGDATWIEASGEGVGGAEPTVSLHGNPGESGITPGDSQIHDWYLALSASPDSVGDKVLFGLFVKTEFL